MREGSSGDVGAKKLDDGTETFFRKSEQRLRLEKELTYGLVLEQVRINPARRTVTFIGADRTSRSRRRRYVQATTRQPIFHVEHVATGGTGNATAQLEWRMVSSLTDGPNQQLMDSAALRQRVPDGVRRSSYPRGPRDPLTRI